MASSKNTTLKVKLTSVLQKKRRKSDLVVMWHSIVDATVKIFTAIHLLLLGVLESARLVIWNDEIQDIRQFLKNYLPTVPDDFSNSWRDGKLLCILLNKLQPGCIPEAETLDHNYALRNMYHAFDILERKFGISPTATVEQLVVCVEGSHLKLLEILSQLKKETENKLVPSIHVEEVELENEKHNSFSDSQNCISKGTGLMVAFVSRPANFVVFISTMTDISLVIEIKGPKDTVCRERITKRSPKKKMSTTLLEKSRPPFIRSNSFKEKNNYQAEVDKAEDCEKCLIPLEYDISLDKISVTYTPLAEGEHVISILWYGQHVSDSPYVVQVEPAMEAKIIYSAKKFTPIYNLLDTSDDNANKERKNGTFTIQKAVNKIERIGKVIKRRVLRHIVKIKDKDIIVDSNDIEHLAAALLKMDYEIQTDPSKSRRNSWGFDGDAERKISAIRQFFIPLHELDSQNMKLHGRSRSLTINSNRRMPLKRCNSLEDEDFIRQTKLETVSEDSSNGYPRRFSENMDQNEEEFAYINEDFQITEQQSVKNQVGIEDENTENVFMSSTLYSCAQEKRLQSLPTEEENENSRNDLNASICLELPQNNLTGSSKSSEKSAVQNEMHFNSDIYEDIENELKMNANLVEEIEDSCRAFNLENDSGLQQHFFTDSNEFCKTSVVKNRIPYKSDMYDDIEKGLRLNANTFSDSNNLITSGAFSKSAYLQNQKNNEISPKINCFDVKNGINKKKCDSPEENIRNYDSDVPFSRLMPQEKHDSKATLKFSFPTVGETNNWRSPLYKSSKNAHSFRLKRHHQYSFECKRCRRLEIVNRKLIARNKKSNETDSLHSEINISEALCSSQIQSSDALISKTTEMNLNPAAKNKDYCPNPKQNKNEFKKSELKFCESPGKYSFYYYSQSPEDSTITPSKCYQSSNIAINVQANNIVGNTLPLSSERETFTNSLNNSNHDYIYNNSTLRLNYDSPNNLTSPEFELNNPMIKFKEVSDVTESQIKEHNLVSLGQYHFNQFNPSAEKNKGSLIKNKIKKLERAMMRNSQKANSKYSSRSSISSDTVNVKDKLTFWENLSRKDKNMNQIEANITDDSISLGNNFQNEHLIPNANGPEHDDKALSVENATDEFFWPRADTLNDLQNNLAPNNENTSSQHTDFEKPQFPCVRKQSLKMKRSFSDPMLLDPALRDSLVFVQNPLLNKQKHVLSTDNMSSSGDYLESSVDDGLYSSDPFVSTEDEYIDDEIPGNPLLMHWGDLNLMKSLKTESMSKYKEYCQFVDTESLKNQFQSIEICPSECKVFGIGTYYGYVAVKNRFQVLTKGAGNGNLSASVQGFGKHDVSFVSVKYKRKDIYEVTYQVLRPGLYLISLRWMEKPIVGSPFLCKVTF